MDNAPDLQDVTAFLAVVDTGSFTAAAKRLGLAKSNISRRVAHLEQQLGARLLERTTRKQHLTEVGETYHAHVTGAVAQLAEAAHSVSEMQGQPRGRLHVTAPADWHEAMGPLVAEFTRKYPQIHLEVELSQRRVDLVAEGFDVALRAGTLTDSTLVARKVGQGHKHLYASPDYIEEHGIPTKPEELAEHACVLFRGRNGASQWTLLGADGQHEITVHGTISTPDYGLIRHALIHSAGIGSLPDTLGAPSVRDGQLRVVLPAYCTGRGDLHVVYPSARFLSSKVRVFVDFCAEWINAEVDRSIAVLGLPTPKPRGRRRIKR